MQFLQGVDLRGALRLELHAFHRRQRAGDGGVEGHALRQGRGTDGA